jgi:hypothetical protein
MIGLRTYQRNKNDELCSCGELVVTDIKQCIQEIGVVYQVFIYRGWQIVRNHLTFVLGMSR